MNNSHDATKTNKQQDSDAKKSEKTSDSGKLILIRHTESEWNALGKWTGHTDVSITAEGRRQAEKIGEMITDLELHHAYTSDLIRTIETLDSILKTAQQKSGLPRERQKALSERDYGDYTGMNKWEVLDQLGKDTFQGIRRSWEHTIPNGETLKMVYERAVPFYKENILPKLQDGKNVVIVSHGNTIRALIKYLEDISDEGIAEVEMPHGQILIYHVTPEGRQYSKETRKIEIAPSKA